MTEDDLWHRFPGAMAWLSMYSPADPLTMLVADEAAHAARAYRPPGREWRLPPSPVLRIPARLNSSRQPSR